VKVNRVSGRLIAAHRDQRFGGGVRAEQFLLELRRGGGTQMGEVLVFGELTDHGEYRGDVGARGGPHGK